MTNFLLKWADYQVLQDFCGIKVLFFPFFRTPMSIKTEVIQPFLSASLLQSGHSANTARKLAGLSE